MNEFRITLTLKTKSIEWTEEDVKKLMELIPYHMPTFFGDIVTIESVTKI